jgi:hypothetical protein
MRARAAVPKTGTETYLLHHILDLGLQLLLRSHHPLPDLIAHHATLQQCAERLLPRPDLNDATNVLLCAREERCTEYRVGDFGGLFVVVGKVVEERQVDVALGVGGEVGCEGERGRLLPPKLCISQVMV